MRTLQAVLPVPWEAAAFAGVGAGSALDAAQAHNVLLQTCKPSYCWGQRMLTGLPEGSSGQALRNESVMESVGPAAGFQVKLLVSESASFSWLASCHR